MIDKTRNLQLSSRLSFNQTDDKWERINAECSSPLFNKGKYPLARKEVWKDENGKERCAERAAARTQNARNGTYDMVVGAIIVGLDE